MPQIAIVGDYQTGNPTHETISSALRHVDSHCDAVWIATGDVRARRLEEFAGIWCAPGSPFRSLDGALAAIRFARETRVPFIGTCAGFQHAILEIARNVLHIPGAASAEYEPDAAALFVSRLACSLVGTLFVPQTASTAGNPHPLICAFVRHAAAGQC
jgi:CTP synthase (UTP-ammonia lyase)